MKYTVPFLFLFVLTRAASGAGILDTAQISNGRNTFIKYNNIEIFEDKTNCLSFQQVQSASFAINKNEVPNLNLSKSTFWIRLHLINRTLQDRLLLRIPYPTLDSVTAYFPGSDNQYTHVNSGVNVPFNDRKFRTQDILFELPIPPGGHYTVYLKIKSKGPILVPVFIGTPDIISSNISRDDMIFGIYLGVIVVMFLYNLFIFFSVKDTNYLMYVIYILAVGITQICLKGYGYRYLWHNSLFITNQSVFWSGALSGIAAVVFVKYFLHTRKKIPVIDKILNIFITLDLLSIVLSLASFYYYSYQIINTTALFGAITLLISGIILSVRGYRPAKFYLVAWSFFLLSVIIFVLETFSIFPYNLFTQNILLIGSALEAILLSFALADKINTFKKEKEESQAAALEASQKNEQLIKEQNVVLESTVKERTKSLQKANGNLNKAIKDLKSTQSQLVHAEKMASLGQLTAGIAHEINNPINFVKSNIRPLQLDMEDLMEVIKKYEAINGPDNIEEKLKEIENFKKQIDLDYISTEIQSLISGIEEGAVRTADIVKGLRTFSRLDESELKQASIHDGIDATLTLLRSSIPGNVSIIRHYGDVPPIECFAGKLNQVFMNILTNSLQAIKSKPDQGDESITITTSRAEDHVIISIADTGGGMTDKVKEKMFDPFFTTKEVGEGTGLGLSIVFNIIEKHHGEIEVTTMLGKGSEFIITLPMNQENKD